jgi:hypothetical protein
MLVYQLLWQLVLHHINLKNFILCAGDFCFSGLSHRTRDQNSSLLSKVVNNIKEVNPYCHNLSFDGPAISEMNNFQLHIKAKFSFCFIIMIKQILNSM